MKNLFFLLSFAVSFSLNARTQDSNEYIHLVVPAPVALDIKSNHTGTVENQNEISDPSAQMTIDNLTEKLYNERRIRWSKENLAALK